MRLLVVDTADSRGSVAVVNGSTILHVEPHGTDQDYSSWLLPAAHRALAESGLTHSQIEGYAVCNGPGSFTGIRVGLTTVKAWAEVYAKPVAAASRLQCLAAAVDRRGLPAEPFVASYLDARREQIFAAVHRRSADGLERIGHEAVISPANFITKVTENAKRQPVRWRTPDPTVLTSLPEWPELASLGHVLEVVPSPFAGRLAQLALQKFRTGDTVDALSLDAEYLRRSDAEIFWKGNPSAFRP